MSEAGRPSLFTPERRKAILDAIGAAVPYEFAAEGNGICEETLYAWIRQGKKDKKEGIQSDFRTFSEDLKHIEMTRMRSHLDTIKEKPERWQADAWILERRWWKQFSPNAAVVEFEKRLKLLEGASDEEKGNEKEV